MNLHRRVPETPVVDTGANLAGLSFVLLRHEHSDHFDLDMPLSFDNICRYFLSVPAARIVITHLEEFNRPPESCWVERHYRMVQTWFTEHAPDRELVCCRTGDAIDL